MSQFHSVCRRGGVSTGKRQIVFDPLSSLSVVGLGNNKNRNHCHRNSNNSSNKEKKQRKINPGDFDCNFSSKCFTSSRGFTFVQNDHKESQAKSPVRVFPTLIQTSNKSYCPHNFQTAIQINSLNSSMISNFDSHTRHCRKYHSTPKKEILPLIALGTLIFVGTYSFKALQTMDEEWEEYEEALREYKLEHGLSDDDDDIDLHVGSKPSSASSSSSSSSRAHLFTQGIIAIDLGSTNIRIAYYDHNSKSNKSTNVKPKVIVNREGGRSTPNYIIIDTDGSIVSGTMAAAKIFERSKSNNPVLNPYQLLVKVSDTKDEKSSNDQIMTMNYAIQNVISSLAKDALEQTLGSSRHGTSKLLFSIDNNGADSNTYNTQPIFTYPPARTNSNDTSFLEYYQNATNELSSPSTIAKFIPEPICAIKGAKYHNLLPKSSSSPMSSTHMVIDVGGKTTSISIINEKDNNIIHHSRLDTFGGETIIDSLMNYLSKSFYGTTIDNVNDTMGLQRLYDSSKSAIMEIGGAKHGRVQINIPYLSVDEKMQPKHLNLGLSVKVLEKEFDSFIQTNVIPNITSDANTNSALSQTMSIPKDLKSLLASMIMKTFEDSSQNPFALESVLVVGGGARSLMMQSAVKSAFSQLAGEQFVQDKVVIPGSDVLIEELVVLGATLENEQ